MEGRVGISTWFNGEIYSFGGRQFETTMPNGEVVKSWSPPWSEESEEQQAAAVLILAAIKYAESVGADVDGLLAANRKRI